MNRCLVAFALALLAALPAHAQRVFERNALRGELQLTSPPEALLNGQPVRLSPGSRIRDPRNLIVLSGTVVGQKLLVNYTLDGFGLVHNVWILSADEAARQPWPKTAAEAAAWSFDSTMQRWTKP
jgi:hypothetical protein